MRIMTCARAAPLVPLPASHHPPSVRPPTSKTLPPPTAFFSTRNADRPTWAAPLSSARRERGYGLSATASGRRRGRQREPGGVSDGNDDDGLEEEDDGDVPLMPLEEMARWLENKPAGFGEGKRYDTTLEEQLFYEMERSRKAQLANINKLKNEAKSAAAARRKKQEPRRKEIDVISSAARVRMWNLPRKKNIHRDLLLAFKGFSGIVNISPAVSGNQKTRDPICKGFAFFDFESEEAANRFVQKYSNTHVLFGKVQKQITCVVVNSRSSSNASEQSVDGIQTFSQPKVTELGVEVPTWSDMNELSQNSCGETIDTTVVDKTGQECGVIENGTGGLLPRFEAIETGIHHSDASLSYDGEKGRDKTADALDSNLSTPLQRRRKQKDSKKKTIKKISAKTSNLSLPGSVTRLKIRERAVLTGVFSKYGGCVAVPLSEES
ncbi:putative RNA-binding motif, single-stranded-interacting protein 1 [Cocos nucifera]|uniref:Putative RNA-binding motif, single-stranded-interacting protein 1 n=1 Tax=Cocos nucifera TaxID=13894 RepID=A0A8K0HU42_COCNU|nr:putative RNA-binding motif, single-stranded-interacting protein 1 [Cocos nucifera]